MKIKKAKEIEGSEGLQKDDIALLFRPTFKSNRDWTGKIDLNAILMHTQKLNNDNQEIIKDSMYALVTCFHLLNNDAEFAKRISDTMLELEEAGELELADSNTTLSTWTKTEGNA